MSNLQDDLLSSEDIEKVIELLRSGRQLTMSDKVIEFEQKFAEYLKVEHAVFVNSGSSANLLALAALVNPDQEPSERLYAGDEVLVPAVCWSTSLWPILQMNLVPIIVDTDPKTFQIDLQDMRRKLSNKTRAVMLVHIIGNGPDMDTVTEFCLNNNLIMVEDTCEALGTTYHQDRYLGVFGKFGTFSFYYSHHITTIEGGMIVCHTQKDADLLRCLRSHGYTRNLSIREELCEKYPNIDRNFMFINVGYNMRSTEINAVLGLTQLEKLDQFNQTRRHNFSLFKKMLLSDARNNGKLSMIDATEGTDPAWFCIPITVDVKYCHVVPAFRKYLSDNAVQNRPIVSGNFTRQPIFEKWGFDMDPETFCGAEQIHFQSFYIGLPCLKVYEPNEVQTLLDIFLADEFWANLDRV
jgi:CDP-6-deoxy-D-xylo-4-hexulose-3-dehydrase